MKAECNNEVIIGKSNQLVVELEESNGFKKCFNVKINI